VSQVVGDSARQDTAEECDLGSIAEMHGAEDAFTGLALVRAEIPPAAGLDAYGFGGTWDQREGQARPLSLASAVGFKVPWQALLFLSQLRLFGLTATCLPKEQCL
jgi:hypothetical protein